MKYLVLARRYRPQFFRDVVGQEAVLQTLKNALTHKRVAHAYLFCGSRGIGKTTLARLFAKALNCQAPSPECEPCNICPSCVEILSGQSFDVIEIDGASNRGIDDIRAINETVGYAPSHGKYKIYIIDEVHMLTKEAFNALLKTLEEPPERAKFFFATTEPHKVLPTIISRCQRFDLQRLSEIQITTKLLAIVADLKREASREAIERIAQFAEGSLRDAESLLDQILCFADEAIHLEHVQNVLGLVPNEFFESFDTAFAEGNIAYAFELVEKLFLMGKDLTHFLEQLIGYYRRLALFRLSPQMQNAPGKEIERYRIAAKLYTQAQLCYILDTLLASYTEMNKSPMQRVSLEALLLKILRSKQRIPLEVLTRRLSELEDHVLKALQEPSGSQPPQVSPQTINAPILPSAKETTANPLQETPQLETVPFYPQPTVTLVEEAPQPEAVSHHPQPTVTPVQEAPQIETVPEAKPPIHTNTVRHQEALPLETKNKEHPPSTEPLMTPQVHTETLLRFAAVELEGTVQMEK